MDNEENTTYTQEREVEENTSTDMGMGTGGDMGDMQEPQNKPSFGALIGLILLAVLLALAALVFYGQDDTEEVPGAEGESVIEETEDAGAGNEGLEDTDATGVEGELEAEVETDAPAE